METITNVTVRRLTFRHAAKHQRNTHNTIYILLINTDRQTDLQSEQTDTPQSTLSLSLQLKAADSSPHTYKRTTAHYNKPLHSKRFEGTSYSVMMEDSIILLNAGTIQQDCTASQPRRMHKHRHENSKYKPLQYSSHTQSVPPSIILTL